MGVAQSRESIQRIFQVNQKRGDTMSEIQPCPFCGKPVRKPYFSNLRYQYSIGCFRPTCQIRPQSPPFDTEEEAIEAWNKRGKVTKKRASAN